MRANQRMDLKGIEPHRPTRLSMGLRLSASLLFWTGAVYGSELDAPLMGAVQSNQVHHVERFLEFGGSVTLIDGLGFSLLEHAAAKGHTEMVHLLANNGADPSYIDPHGNTALHMACREGHEATALALLSLLGTHLTSLVRHVNGKGMTPLQLTLESPASCPLLVQKLITQGAGVDTLNPRDHTTPLWWAAKKGYGVKELLLAKASPDVANQHGITPLMVACYEGHRDVVQVLLTLGHADPNLATPLGITPLMVASYQGRRSIVDLLLYHNAQIQRSSDATLGGGKAYHYALKHGHLEIAQVLQEAEQRTHSAPSEVQALKDELKRIQAQHEHLWGTHQSQLKDSASRFYLENTPSLRAFYQTFSRKAIELFLAYKVLDTGMVERTKEGGLYTAASGIELLGDLIPFPGAGLVMSGISKVMTFVADQKEGEIIKNMAGFAVFLHELDASIELAARNMAYCYESQIRHLTECGAERLAEAALRRFIEYAREGHLKPGEPLWTQLKEAIISYEEKEFLFKTLYEMKPKDLKVATPSSPWTDEGIFRHTGIQLETGDQYVNLAHRHHETYGFRLGRLEDCRRLGYQPIAALTAGTPSSKPTDTSQKPSTQQKPDKEEETCTCTIS